MGWLHSGSHAQGRSTGDMTAGVGYITHFSQCLSGVRLIHCPASSCKLHPRCSHSIGEKSAPLQKAWL